KKDAPPVFGQLDVIEMRPPFRVDADGRTNIDAVVVLEPLRPHVVPPLDVFGLPVLERAQEPLVARQVHVVRDALSGNHRRSLNLVIWSSGYLVIDIDHVSSDEPIK